MSDFVDQLMVKYSDPANLKALFSPPADVGYTRLKALFAALFDLPFASLHDVQSVDVLGTEFQRPFFPQRRTIGTWTQTIPNHTRTDVLYEGSDGFAAEWIDLSALLTTTVVLQVDAGGIESARVGDIGTFTTLAEFKAKFRYFDLDAFMAAHGFTTVDQVKAAYQYLLAEITFKAPPPFDPNNPANTRRFEVHLAVLLRDALDLGAALRGAKLARTAIDQTLAFRREEQEAEVRTAYAPVVIFPAASVVAPYTVDALTKFFSTENVLALFVTP
jgi:hypothetical protein